VRAAERERWAAENRAAIEDHNRRIAERGLWSDGKRQF
jgi:post-segregation antitoxin (ccd killing protein)